MGAAFDRVVAALGAAGCRPHVYGNGQATAHCPGKGHWRGDVHPSLVITPAGGCVLVCCHGNCATEDVLGVIGLTMADLFDEPRRPAAGAPAIRGLWDAIGRAKGLSIGDRYVYVSLLRRADWATGKIPPRFQPGSQRELSAACGADLDTVKQASAHLAAHHWLTLSCGADGCRRPVPHPGRGHRIIYGLPGIGDDCPGAGCRSRARKGGKPTLLREAGKKPASPPGGGGRRPPPATYHQEKTAPDLRLCEPDSPFSEGKVPPFYGGGGQPSESHSEPGFAKPAEQDGHVNGSTTTQPCAGCGRPVWPMGQAQTRKYGRVLCSACRPDAHVLADDPFVPEGRACA